jgi:hypothetical protein
MKPNTYEEIKPELEDLLFFVDDTGHETFAGNQGYYGLGGCVVRRVDYEHLKTKWRNLRIVINGEPDTPLHASVMERKPENFAALSEFFLDPSFLRIAVTTTKEIGLPPGMHPCVPVMGQLQEEIAIVASALPCKNMSGWIREGKVTWKETVEHGIENAPTAFLKLFKGENLGKMLVKLV